MTCEIVFLPVGNADCIVIHSEDALVIVDLGQKPRFIYNWLQQKNFKTINRIYITHSHRDHFPFASLVNLVRFLELWFSNNGEIKIFSLPYGVRRNAIDKLDTQRNTNADYKELEQALHSLDDWDRIRKVRFVKATCDPTPYSLTDIKIYSLHPRDFFVDNHKSNINEISLLLRVEYGTFAAMLLGDLEGAGLADYLSVVRGSASASEEAKANIVKIPHHGAYPKNGKDLEELLTLIDAELAILSVGSKNIYGHVEPKLFKALIELQQNSDRRLTKFICTEVTRTCVHSASDRSTMGKAGLNTSKKCAGEITVIADLSGTWELKTETDHLSEVASCKYAACNERGDLI